MTSLWRLCRTLPTILLAAALVTVMVVAPSGCLSIFTSRDSKKHTNAESGLNSIRSGSRTSRQVKFDGAGLVLGVDQKPAISAEQLLTSIEELLNEDQNTFRAAARIQLYPDVTLNMLRNATNKQAESKALHIAAQIHDQTCSRRGAPDGWSIVLRDRAANPDRYAAYEKTRSEFLQHMRQGRFDEAVAIDLTSTLNRALGTPLRIDAWRLMAMARLLNDNPQDAAAALQTAIALAGEKHVYQAVQLSLLLSEAQRRAGKVDQAIATWQRAVQGASAMLSDSEPIAAVTFWQRASYLRPANVGWPNVVTLRIREFNQQCGLTTPDTVDAKASWASFDQPGPAFDESMLWTMVGHWRFERDEPQAALVAFKRAEGLLKSQPARDQLRLAQARAFTRLNQPAAASAILVGLTKNNDDVLSRRALATLGALKLQNGSTQQGLALLRRAVDQTTPAEWPGRAQAEADLGLAFLMIGDEPAGLRWLHSAQRRFETAKELELLRKCLWNEIEYFEHTDRPAKAEAVRRRLES